jgi:hypothetical protein
MSRITATAVHAREGDRATLFKPSHGSGARVFAPAIDGTFGVFIPESGL